MSIQAVLMEVLKTVLFAIITVAFPMLLQKFGALIDEMQQQLATQIQSTILSKYVNYAIDIIQDVVNEVSQTYVDKLKENGQWDDTTASEAKELAMVTIKSLLSDECVKYLQELYGDINSWISVQIESYIKNSKN